MLYTELNQTERRRFNHNFVQCPVCKESIDKSDSFQMIKFPYSGRKAYMFFHTKCLAGVYGVMLKGGNQNGEEI